MRLVDDFRAVGVNDVVSSEGPDIPHAPDTFLDMVLLCEQIQPGAAVKAFSVDFAHAYNHVPLIRSHGGFATILLAPPGGDMKMAPLRTHPFDSRRSPANWGRVAAFVRWSRVVLFGINLAAYVGDFFSVAPAAATVSDFGTVKRLAELAGLELDDWKGNGPTTEIELLVAHLS